MNGHIIYKWTHVYLIGILRIKVEYDPTIPILALYSYV